MRVIILGFDGLDYYRVKKFLPFLSTFNKLKNYIGRLESTIPPITAPAWVSMFTGKTPAEHGMYGFINIETRKVMNYRDIRTKKLWDYLDNLSFCVVNLPMTYPPDNNINGLMVSGFPTYTADFRKIVYPRKWVPILEKKIKLPRDIDEIKFRKKYNESSGKAFEYMLNLMNERAEAYLKLMDFDEFDIFWFVFRETDVVQHFYRDEMKILDIYKNVDAILMKFLRKMKKNDWVIVVSDHGHNTVERVVYVDNLLRSILSGGLKSIKISLLNRLATLAWRYPSLMKVAKFVKKKLGEKIVTSKISEGITYNHDSWSISVQDKNLKAKIIDVLSNVKVDGKKVFLDVLDSRRLYKNSKIKLPDIFFVPNYTFNPASGVIFGRDEIIDSPIDPSQNGTHTLNGIYIFYNKDKREINFTNKDRKIWEISNIIRELIR